MTKHCQLNRTYSSYYLALDIISNSICEIQCLALNGFSINTVHNLISKEKKSWQSRDFNLGLLGGKQQFFLFATQPQYCGEIRLIGDIDIVVTYQEATLLWVDLLDLPQELSELGPGQISFETLLIQVNSVEQSHLGLPVRIFIDTIVILG